MRLTLLGIAALLVAPPSGAAVERDSYATVRLSACEKISRDTVQTSGLSDTAGLKACSTVPGPRRHEVLEGSRRRTGFLRALFASSCFHGCICSWPAAPHGGPERTPGDFSDADTTSASPQTPEATSLFGKPLVSAPPSGEQKARLEADLAKAQADYDRDPSSAEAAIWLGRRLAYLGRFRDAIEVYTRGIERHPDEARLYRHRGHRYITTRTFDAAIADLRRASQLVAGKPDEVEPDGAPNKAGIPRSTLQSNIWYHLGLAQYLRGDFQGALGSYREGMKVSRVNDDMLVATSDWLYMTLRRLKRDALARQVLDPITEQMDVLENGAYHARLLMYKGLRTPESVLNLNTADDIQIATQGYGVGNWYLVNGDRAKAKAIYDRVVAGKAWPAFGFIAAEADLKRGF